MSKGCKCRKKGHGLEDLLNIACNGTFTDVKRSLKASYPALEMHFGRCRADDMLRIVSEAGLIALLKVQMVLGETNFRYRSMMCDRLTKTEQLLMAVLCDFSKC